MLVTRLKVLRVQKGLKVKEVAQALGIHPNLLSRIECGQSWIPPKYREKLADFYNTSVAEICNEVGWPTLYNKPTPNIVREEG